MRGCSSILLSVVCVGASLDGAGYEGVGKRFRRERRRTMQRSREYAKLCWCEQDNQISFPMAGPGCHAPPCRRSFSGDFAHCLATPNASAYETALHHFSDVISKF